MGLTAYWYSLTSPSNTLFILFPLFLLAHQPTPAAPHTSLAAIAAGASGLPYLLPLLKKEFLFAGSSLSLGA